MKPALAAALSTMAHRGRDGIARPRHRPEPPTRPGNAGTTLAVGPQGLRAGAFAAGADPHRAQGPRQPDLSGLGLLRHAQGHLVTNFHVVSRAALKPERHDLVYVTADGRGRRSPSWPSTCATTSRCSRRETPAPRRFDALALRPASRALLGRRILAGQPAGRGLRGDGEPTAGLVKRSFYPQIFFGARSPGGMSGDPALDQDSQVISVNVAQRVVSEQVQLLSATRPSCAARALLARRTTAPPLKTPATCRERRSCRRTRPGRTDQALHRRRAGSPTPTPRYRVPVPRDGFMRAGAAAESPRAAGSIWSAPTA